MKLSRHAINNPEQWGMNQAQVKVFKKKLRGMKRVWIEECEIVGRVDPEVPIVRKQGKLWRVYE